MIPAITLCQGAVGLASLSLVLQLAAAIARSRSSIYMDVPAEPKPAPVVLTKEEPPSLKLSRVELLQHARALGVRNARWRNSARKTDLLQRCYPHRPLAHRVVDQLIAADRELAAISMFEGVG